VHFLVKTIDIACKYCQNKAKAPVTPLVLPDQSEVLAIRSGRADGLTDQRDVLKAVAEQSKVR